MFTAEAKLSAKQRQIEVDKSRKRWMTFLSVTAGLAVLFLASLAWQNSDHDDAQSATTSAVQSRSATD